MTYSELLMALQDLAGEKVMIQISMPGGQGLTAVLSGTVDDPALEPADWDDDREDYWTLRLDGGESAVYLAPDEFLKAVLEPVGEDGTQSTLVLKMRTAHFRFER